MLGVDTACKVLDFLFGYSLYVSYTTANSFSRTKRLHQTMMLKTVRHRLRKDMAIVEQAG